MVFFDPIKRGWKLSKLSWAVVKKDPELMVYTIFSGVMFLMAISMIYVPELLEMSWTNDGNGNFTTAYFAWIFCCYMSASIFVVFWNCAIVTSAHERLMGGDPTFASGIVNTTRHLPTIVLWGVISGTVGLILRALRMGASERRDVFSQVLSFIAETAWWIMTFFIVPMIVIEGRGVKDSLSNSKSLFSKTWGETIGSGVGIGLIGLLFAIPAVIVGIFLYQLNPQAGMLVLALSVGLIVIWTNTAESVSRAALYMFAKTGEMPKLYQENGMKSYTFETD
tara:strand:- start:44 stop:883 length:840 start_codon:yes stop_codon:yes gene_type:complete